MTLYRILYIDNGQQGHYVDVEGTNLGAVIWNVAQEIGSGHLVDTMILPGKDNAYQVPHHAYVQPSQDLET